jgi:hypothetical protein
MRSTTFGRLSAPPAWLWYGVGVVVWLAATALVLVPQLLRNRAAAIEEAAAWAIAGPPCPQLGPAAAARHPYRPKKSFGYAGANFGFVYGHVACAQIHDDAGRAMLRGHPVCQFTSPAVVTVRVGKIEAFFTPGLGQRATVSVQDGTPRCVLGGDFYGQNNF